jgi:hypothetical protein
MALALPLTAVVFDIMISSLRFDKFFIGEPFEVALPQRVLYHRFLFLSTK